MNIKSHNSDLIINKQVSFSYNILERYTAGIVLHGAEVKSLRLRNANLKGSHCYFYNNELWLSGMHIGPYAPAPHYKQSPTRSRKMLLKKHELRKLQKKKTEKTLTIIPIRLFLNNNKIKVEIALAQGKKKYDKRATIKDRDVKRAIERKMKSEYT